MTKSTCIALFSASAVLLAASTTAAIAKPPSKADMEKRLTTMLERIDTDQSGGVSFEEFSVRGDERFSRADANGDGILTAEEREAQRDERQNKRQSRRQARDERAQERLAEVDTDNDGSISLDEHTAHQRARFAELDTDSSGDVSLAEFKSQMEQRRGNREGRRQ